MDYVFEQSIDTFVREVLQNSHDQKLRDVERVEVDFDLIQLSGEQKAGFLQSIDWPTLRQHLEGAARSESPAALRIRRELGEIRDRPIRLLRITDRGTRGLVGGEDQNGENFKALCRNVLDTSEGDNKRGGSHGLGKVVLWAFSGVSTVLFHSRLGDGTDAGRRRFLARTGLPSHTAFDTDWAGSGWYGVPDTERARAVSAWDDEASDTAKSMMLDRPGSESGTSIMIVDLDEPLAEIDRPLENVADDIVASSSRWFWPAITRGTLRVRVRVVHDDDVIQDELVGLTPEVTGFAESLAETDLRPELREPGDVAERQVAVEIPPRRSEKSAGMTLDEPANAVLRIRAAGSQDDESRLNQVALTRGAGMVVQYWSPPRHRNIEQTFQAVLSTGLAAGSAASDRAMELFLRACEPPAHDRWTAKTARQRSMYEPGAGAKLKKMEQDIQARIDEALFATPPTGEKGPERLRKLFRVGTGSGGGGAGSRHAFSTSVTKGELIDSIWNVHADLHHVKGTGPWWAKLELYLDAESGRGTQIPINMASTDEWAVISREDGTALVIVDDEQHASVRLQSSEADSALSTRTRLRLDVRYKAGARS